MAEEKAWTIRQIASLTGHEDRAWQVAWNPDAPLLASCSTDKTVRLYSYSMPAELALNEEHDYRFTTATTIPTGHTRTVRALSWAPGGKSLAVGSFDSTISVWERSTGEDSGDEGEDQPSGEWEMVSQLEGHENECKSVAYSHSGTLLASCSRDKSVWIWEVQPDAEFECLSVMMEHSQDVKAVTFHPREDILASASYDDTIKLYIDDPSDDWYPFATLKGHTSTVWSLSFSPCGRFLASSSDDKSIRIWRHVPADTGSRSPGDWRPALDWQAHSRPIYSISWGRKSPVNASEDVLGYIASAGGDGRIRIWKLSETEAGLTYAEMCSLDKAHGDAEINCISWCPRPNMYGVLATAGDDGIVNVWKVSPVQIRSLAYKTVIQKHRFIPCYLPPSESFFVLLSRLFEGHLTNMGSCKACYAEKQKCRPSTDAYAGCLPCQTKGIPCEPRKISTSKGSEPRIDSGGEPSLLRLYESDSSSSKGATIHAPNFDDRGFEISRQRVHRRSGHRASRSAGAITTIDAIQAAASCSVVKQELLEPSEVVELYHLYMTRWNPCTLILDPGLHTLGYLSRSEFLLLVVLAVAAQDYSDRPEVHGELARYARRVGGKCLLNQAPNVDMVQAFLLLSLFPDWSTSFDENRSWLDLGLALDLTKQLQIDKMAETYDPENSAPSGPERNIFRTWMICHNLDAITTLVFDRPSSCVSIPDSCRRWPKDPDGSPEGIVGVLTTPLQEIGSHIKHKKLEKTLHGAAIISPATQDEGTAEPRSLDSQMIEKMANGVSEARVIASNRRSGGGLVVFWLHLAHVTTEYSRLLLLSQRPVVDQGSNHSSEMLDSAISILRSYVDIFEEQSCARYTPGYLFAYGTLAVAVARKFIHSANNDEFRTMVTTLIKRFSEILRLSPAVTRNETEYGIFVQIVDHVVRGEDTTPRIGGKSEPLSIQEPAVPMLTTVFPPWWRLYL